MYLSCIPCVAEKKRDKLTLQLHIKTNVTSFRHLYTESRVAKNVPTSNAACQIQWPSDEVKKKKIQRKEQNQHVQKDSFQSLLSTLSTEVSYLLENWGDNRDRLLMDSSTNSLSVYLYLYLEVTCLCLSFLISISLVFNKTHPSV